MERRPCHAACTSEYTTELCVVGICERCGNVEQRNVERLALGGSRSLEFLEFLDTVLMDVRQLGDGIFFDRTRFRHSGIRPRTPRLMIHGSMVTDGEK